MDPWAGRDTITLIRRETGELIQKADNAPRKFLTEIIAEVDHRAVLAKLYRETAYVILLVRDRLERERPIEAEFEVEVSEIG